MEELKILQQEHWKAVMACTRRLQLKAGLEKLVAGLRAAGGAGGAGGGCLVTGGEMAKIVEMLQGDQREGMFANGGYVQEAVANRNVLVMTLLEELAYQIKEHKRKMEKMPPPEKIPQLSEFRRTTIPDVDLSTSLSANIITIGDIFTVKP
jgi:hypothetical protein